METSAKIEKSTDFAATPAGMADRWGTEIEASKQELDPFHRDARKIVKRFLDKRDAWEEGESRVNLFWSTIKVLLSMLYARPPKADVSRSWQDADDDQARVASTIMQRMLNKDFEEQVSSWDGTIRQGIEDWLVVGMGQCWMRYEVEIEEEEIPAIIDPMTGIEIEPATMVEKIVDEEAELDYVHYQDFFWSPARTWREVRWVARRVHMTRERLDARFGEAIAKSVPMLQAKRENDEQTTKNDPWARAEVYEIWCKENKKVYWYAKGAPVILDVPDAVDGEHHERQLPAAGRLRLRAGPVPGTGRDQHPDQVADARGQGRGDLRQGRRRRAADVPAGVREPTDPGRQLGHVLGGRRDQGQGRLGPH